MQILSKNLLNITKQLLSTFELSRFDLLGVLPYEVFDSTSSLSYLSSKQGRDLVACQLLTSLGEAGER